MQNSPDKIWKQAKDLKDSSKDLDTHLFKIIDILKRRNKGKDISEDETKILNDYRPPRTA